MKLPSRDMLSEEDWASQLIMELEKKLTEMEAKIATLEEKVEELESAP